MKVCFTYAALEHAAAARVAQPLVDLGWSIQLRGHGEGAPAHEDIRAALEGCDGLLALVFDGEDAIPQVNFEVGVAVERGLEVLVFRLLRAAPGDLALSKDLAPRLVALDVLADPTRNSSSTLSTALQGVVAAFANAAPASR